MNHKKLLMSVLGAFALSLTAAANAATVTIDVSGIESWDGAGDADNTVLSIDLGAGNQVTGLGWDVDITPVGDSWYSEATALFTDSGGGQGISVTPGAADGSAGNGIPMAYSSGGILNLADNGLPAIVLADGILLIEFYDSFDDFPDTVDATWGGELTIEYSAVPLPGAVILLFSGLLSAGFLGRRKA